LGTKEIREEILNSWNKIRMKAQLPTTFGI
jgi:hypothetical protein